MCTSNIVWLILTRRCAGGGFSGKVISTATASVEAGRGRRQGQQLAGGYFSKSLKLKSNTKRQKRQKYMHRWLNRNIIIFFALHIRSYPNLFLVFHYEIKRSVPIIVAKSFQIETFDLKSLIRPAVFDPITSNPNQVSFNISLQINRSQIELFSRHNQL